MASRAAAEAAGAALRARFGGQPWFLGTSLSQRKCLNDPAPFEITANVRSLDAARALPREINGVQVQLGIWPSGLPILDGLGASAASGLRFQDVLAGALVGASAFMVGKIAVDQILISRKEHFERKGQPKAAVKAKETTLDGIIKLAGIGYSIYRMSEDLPELYAEIKKYNP